MFHIIANFSANSDGRNQTQNCSFNTSHTGILFTKYRSKFLIFKLHKLLWKKYKLRSLSKLLDCGQRLSKECKNLKGIILIFWNTIFRETHRLDHEHSPTPPRPNLYTIGRPPSNPVYACCLSLQGSDIWCSQTTSRPYKRVLMG